MVYLFAGGVVWARRVAVQQRRLGVSGEIGGKTKKAREERN